MSLAEHQILGLTVHRPWSEFLAAGIKTVECRTWPPHDEHLGRYLAVHASTRWDQESAEFIGRNHARFRVDQPRTEGCAAGIIAVVRLVGWVQRTELGTPGGPTILKMLPGHAFTENDWRWFHSGEYGWVVREALRFSPVAVSGRQKLWVLPKLVLASVRSRWDKARKTTQPA